MASSRTPDRARAHLVGDAKRTAGRAGLTRTSPRSRDVERARLYRAEEAAFEHTLYAEDLGTAAWLDLARTLFGHPWWKASAGTTPDLVPAPAHSLSSLAVLDNDIEEIRVAAGQENAHVLGHEAAHLLAWAHGPDVAAHGREFRAAHLDLASVLGGPMARDMLAEAYSSEGLAVAPRRWSDPYCEGSAFSGMDAARPGSSGAPGAAILDRGLLGTLRLKARVLALSSLAPKSAPDFVQEGR